MKSMRGCNILAVALFAVCLQSYAEAATIASVATFSTPGSSTGSVGPVGSTPSPNNDNETMPSPNVIPYNVFFNTLGILETEFVAQNSGASTEYRFIQTFINNTGVLWTGFLFELGFGTGATFTKSTIADDLDFDTPDRDPVASSAAFAMLNHQADTLDWAGGTVPSIGVAPFVFAIDVPDNLQNVHPRGMNRFTLRQTPIVSPVPVPEPASTLLVVAGFALVVLRRGK